MLPAAYGQGTPMVFEEKRARYAFAPATLDAPRRPGISAIMRIRNGADFLRLAIESHLPHYDEIVACYNDCNDDTPEILAALAREYPGRVRPLHYLPKVHPPLSPGHDATPDGSMHGLANYYNWALAHARYSVAVKLDDDHLAVPDALAQAVALVRADIARGVRGLYTFSGLNLARDHRGRLAVYANDPLVGTGDILYFPVCSNIHWRQAPRFEQLVIHGRRPPKRYLGLLYFHLKHVKPDLGFGNLDPVRRHEARQRFLRTLRTQSFDEFAAPANVAALRRSHNRLEYWLHSQPLLRDALLRLTGHRSPLRVARLQRLPEDLAAIDWQRDLHEQLGPALLSGGQAGLPPLRRRAAVVRRLRPAASG
jgi:hypothetical protein